MKRKEAEDVRDLHSIQKMDEEPTSLIYSDIACKIGKECDFSWNLIYQFFVKEDYSNLPFNKGYKEKAMDTYLNISCSYVHKVVACLTILPCSEVIGIMVQQAHISN